MSFNERKRFPRLQFADFRSISGTSAKFGAIFRVDKSLDTRAGCAISGRLAKTLPPPTVLCFGDPYGPEMDILGPKIARNQGALAFWRSTLENAFAPYSSQIFVLGIVRFCPKIDRYQGGLRLPLKCPKTLSPPTVPSFLAPFLPPKWPSRAQKSADTRAVFQFSRKGRKRPHRLQFGHCGPPEAPKLGHLVSQNRQIPGRFAFLV